MGKVGLNPYDLGFGLRGNYPGIVSPDRRHYGSVERMVKASEQQRQSRWCATSQSSVRNNLFSLL